MTVHKRLPEVLNTDELARFMAAIKESKYCAALSIAFGSGLRVGEIVALKISDDDCRPKADTFYKRACSFN